ncbi:sensor domain-containing diguanylate cyclase [Oxalobacteraceae bacterium OM1]|nr:sensor domain-containing diguanylate cyclase [Oxalobacteraceae bacterium OM1]
MTRQLTPSLRTLVFGSDPRQALRIERLLLASSTYVFGMFIIAYCSWYGLFPPAAFWPVIGGAFVLNALFYVAIRFGWNLRARDPSLTVPQMLVASMVNTYLVFHAHEVRGALLLGYMLILVFGIFKLQRKEFLQIGAVVIGAYTAVILLEFFARKPGFNPAAEGFQWLMMIFVYPWFAWIGGYIGNLRRKQRETNEQLERALAENLRALEVIRTQATCDELTGLYNRRYMLERLQEACARAVREGTPLCLLVLDVDFFKRINDTAGHVVGDRVLSACAASIRRAVRSNDVVARWGGEEFIVLMPAANLASLGEAMERIRRSVASLDYLAFGLEAPVTVSIGGAELQKDESIEELLSAADHALYRAKQGGRNRVEMRAA